MSTKAEREFARIDAVAREACENGEWNHVVDWFDYESITAAHTLRRIRGEWAIDLAVEIHWDGDEPVTRARTIKLSLDQATDGAFIAEGVSDSIGVMIEADRKVGNVGNFAEAIEGIYLGRLKAMFLGSLASGRAF